MATIVIAIFGLYTASIGLEEYSTVIKIILTMLLFDATTIIVYERFRS